MPITVTTEAAQANFYQLLNQLDDGTYDKVIVNDGESELCQIVTKAVYDVADPASAAAAEIDVVAAYAVSPSSQGKGLYRLIKKMRDRLASTAAGAISAVGTITCVAKANLVDTETVTLVNAAGTTYIFEFDTDGGGATEIQVDVSGDVTADDVAATLAGVIDGTGGLTAAANAAVVTVTQSDPGVGGNVAITETVADAGFLVSGFSGGQDADVSAGVIAVKNSKNDTNPRAYIVPADHAAAIGL